MSGIYEKIFLDTYGFSVDELNEENSKTIKQSIRNLRQSYRCNVPVSRYDENEIRKAYMLSYYPNYIFPINKIIRDEVLPYIENFTAKRLKLSFFAAGPAPEVLGCLKALDDYELKKKIDVYILDFEQKWEIERQVTLNLLSEFKNLRIAPVEYISGCDLTADCRNNCSSFINCENRVFKSDILVMENCINHMSDDVDFAEKIRRRLSYMKAGSLFIIIDLDYENVRLVLRKIINTNSEIVEVEASNLETGIEKSVLEIEIPEKIKQFVFTGESDLIQKKNTKYYYAVLKRK